jgi:hypothetical protein
MQDTADNPAVVDTLLAAHVGWKVRFDLPPLLIVQPK